MLGKKERKARNMVLAASQLRAAKANGFGLAVATGKYANGWRCEGKPSDTLAPRNQWAWHGRKDAAMSRKGATYSVAGA